MTPHSCLTAAAAAAGEWASEAAVISEPAVSWPGRLPLLLSLPLALALMSAAALARGTPATNNTHSATDIRHRASNSAPPQSTYGADARNDNSNWPPDPSSTCWQLNVDTALSDTGKYSRPSATSDARRAADADECALQHRLTAAAASHTHATAAASTKNWQLSSQVVQHWNTLSPSTDSHAGTSASPAETPPPTLAVSCERDAARRLAARRTGSPISSTPRQDFSAATRETEDQQSPKCSGKDLDPC